MDLAMQAGGEDNVTVQFIQYGQRKEAQARPKATQKLQPMIVGRPRRSFSTTAAILLLFLLLVAAISVIGFIGYSNVQLRRESDKLGDDVNALQKKFEAAENERDSARQNADNLESQLHMSDKKEETASNKISQMEARVSELNDNLKKVETDRDESNIELKQQVAKLERDLKDANEDIADLQQSKRDLVKKLGKAIDARQDAITAKNEAVKEVKELQHKFASRGQSEVNTASEGSGLENNQTADEEQPKNQSNEKKTSEESNPEIKEYQPTDAQ
jgi:chromosome segregation ATPase